MSKIQRVLPALFLLLLFVGNAYALQVVVNPSPITGTVTKTEPYTTFTAAITLETNDEAAVVFITGANNSNIGLSGPTYVTSSGTYSYKLLLPNQPGTYTGTVKILATGTGQSYQVSFSVTVSSWEEKYKDYFEKGVMYKATLNDKDYLFKIKDISEGAIQLYFDGATYTVAEGESQILLDNLKVEVDSVFTSGAVLKFYTDGASITISKYSTSSESESVAEGEDLSGFHFLITKYSKYIQKDMTYTITVTLVNDTDYRVYLKDVYFENTTVTDEGEKPTRLEDYQLPSYLDPGQELTLKVTIDTRGLEIGKTYTPTLVALGRVGNQDVRAQIDFYITVVKAVQSSEQTQQEQTQQSQQTTETTPPPTQTLRQMTIEIVPPNPQPGDTVTIYVKDARTGDYINANVTVNGNPTSTFVADWCKTYRITATADGYAPATRTVNVRCKNLQVTYSPSSIKEGDTVTFQVVDAETGEAVMANITIDGKPLIGSTWTATPGTHMVVVRAEGYTQKTLTLKVQELPAEPAAPIPEEVNAGEEVTIPLTKKATWEVYDENNVLVASGESNAISFSPAEPGKYTIKLNGKTLASMTVIGATTQQGTPIQLPKNILWWIAGIGVVIVLYDIVKKRRAKTSKSEYPVGFELRPKPKFAMPLSEYEKQQQQGGGSS